MKMPKIGLGTFRLKEQVVIDSVLNGLELALFPLRVGA